MGVELGRVVVLIHDGFITNGKIDELRYSKAVEDTLGISIEFDKKSLDCVLSNVDV